MSDRATTYDESGMTYRLVSTEKQLNELCIELENAKVIAVDTETEGLAYTDIIVGIALSARPDTSYYIPIRHEAIDGVLYDGQLSPETVFGKLKPILETKPCTGHNTPFDIKMFWKDGIDVNYMYDTLIMAHLLGIDIRSKGLKSLVKHFFNHEMPELDSLFPKIGNKKQPILPKILSPEDIRFYGCEDGNWSLQLFIKLLIMIKQRSSLDFTHQLEMKLVKVVAEMESFGVPTSLEFLQENSQQAQFYINKLEDHIISTIRYELDDPEFAINLASPKQLGDLLFNKLGLPPIAFSKKTGNPSTDADTLEALAPINPIVNSILTYRKLKKLDDTYLGGLQDKVGIDGRIRGSFIQTGTASGRFSSKNPNLQNLPKDQIFALWKMEDEDIDAVADTFEDYNNRTLRWDADTQLWRAYNPDIDIWGDFFLGVANNGKQYGVYQGEIYEMWQCKTRCFIETSDDHYLIDADYSQIELRIMAGESLEPTLLDAFTAGDDVHKKTAGVIFNTPFEKVTSEQRHIGKTVNFSLLYGAGPYNISKQLGIEVSEAQDIVNKYFKNLPHIKSWINRVRGDTKMDGYADTIFDRRRYFPNVKNKEEPKLADKELRESVNHHIQGAAADIMKLALVRISKMMKEYFGDKVKIISTVHDSVLLECHESCDKDGVIAVLKYAMENIRTNRMSNWPYLEIDTKIGQTWGVAKDYKVKKEVNRELLPTVADVPAIVVRQIAKERERDSNIYTNPVIWNITVYKPMDSVDSEFLIDFLLSRKDDSIDSSVVLIYPDEDGTMKADKMPDSYYLTMEDEMILRMNIGPATITQDLDFLDVGLVLKGIDFGVGSA